jgi:hypothetical protein
VGDEPDADQRLDAEIRPRGAASRGPMFRCDDLFVNVSPLQLDDTEKKEVLKSLDGDIYTVTRIRLPLLLRLDELLSGGSAVYDCSIVSVEHVLPQNPSVGSQWLVDFPVEEEASSRNNSRD